MAWIWIGKARRGDQRRVARPQQGQAHVAEPFLRADRGDDLVVGVEADAEPLLVSRGDLAAQVVHAGGYAVAVVPRVARGLAELVDDPLLGRVGGVAHPQVDDVDPARALAVLQLVDPAEEIRRQVAHARRDLKVVMLDRLVLLGTRIGLVFDHRSLSSTTTGFRTRRNRPADGAVEGNPATGVSPGLVPQPSS